MSVPAARSIVLSIFAATITAAITGCATKAPDVRTEPASVTPVAANDTVKHAPMPVFATSYFSYDRYSLTEAARAALKHDIDELLADPKVTINVEGHCDEQGTDQYNLDLGWKRAYAARDYLERLGIPDTRLFPISYGRSRPAVIGDNESAWSRNRRVELTVRS